MEAEVREVSIAHVFIPIARSQFIFECEVALAHGIHVDLYREMALDDWVLTF